MRVKIGYYWRAKEGHLRLMGWRCREVLGLLKLKDD